MISIGLEPMAHEGDDAASLATELGRDLAASQRAAWEMLIERELAPAYRLAAIILGDVAEAEDATHDSLLRAWRGWPSLRDPELASAWFQRIVVNECRDRLRRQRRTLAILPRLFRGRDSIDPAGRIGNRDAIGRAFATLSPEARVTLALRFFADLSVDQIAARLGTPAGTIKSRIHRGLHQLREAMEPSESSR